MVFFINFLEVFQAVRFIYVVLGCWFVTKKIIRIKNRQHLHYNVNQQTNERQPTTSVVGLHVSIITKPMDHNQLYLHQKKDYASQCWKNRSDRATISWAGFGSALLPESGQWPVRRLFHIWCSAALYQLHATVLSDLCAARFWNLRNADECERPGGEAEKN
jgi:hypothetical protein